MVPKRVDLVGTRNGEQFTVAVDGLECSVCDFKTIDNNHSGEFTRAISDAYRKAHGLLTEAQIRNRREKLGMTQSQFADYLGVGVASIKRWEQGQIQDKAMDELIRLKTDPEAARENLKEIRRYVPEKYVISSIIMGGEDLELSFRLERQQYDDRVTPMMLVDSELLQADVGCSLAA